MSSSSSQSQSGDINFGDTSGGGPSWFVVAIVAAAILGGLWIINKK
jgi:hypothetical protein